MTEDEAKQKWCPYVGLVKAIEALTGNAEGSNNCMASDCMMWRDHPVKESRLRSEGYCGLANKP